MQGTVLGYSDQVDAVQEGLSNFKAAIAGWLTWVTVIFTVMLLSVAVSQVGLLVPGWRLFCGQPL